MKKPYTTLGLPLDMANRVIKLRDDQQLGSVNEAVQLLFAAYDIINGTGYGGRFSEAVKATLTEMKHI